MNWKTTLILVILAGAAGLWLWKGDDWATQLGLVSRTPEPPPSPAVLVLESFSPTALTRIEITFPSGDPLILERTDSAADWTLPGNWPGRKPEIEELVQTLGRLRTRFHAIPVPTDGDLSRFGLAPAQLPLTVKVTLQGQTHTLLIGEPPPATGETTLTRPAFVRVDGLPEVLQLGPDVLPVLRRPAESYRRRMVFPDVERVKVAPTPAPFGPPGGDAPVTLTLPGEDTERIRVFSPGPQLWGFRLLPLEREFTLARRGKLPEPSATTRGGEPMLKLDRLAEAWDLVLPIHTRDGFPIRDNPDPARLRSLLTAISELWVEEFLPTPPPEEVLGFATTGQVLSVQRRGGNPVTIRFGSIAKIVDREETISVPGGPPGAPPQSIKQKVPVEYRYARIDGSPQVFLVAADKLPNVFVAVGELIDARVARFTADDVQQVVLRPAAQPEVKLTRKKGNPKATNPDDRTDRWFVAAQPNPLLADTTRVTDLLDQLTNLQASSFNAIRYGDSLAPSPTTQVTLTLRERRPEGEPEAPTRQVTLQIANPDVVKQLLPVAVAGTQRLTLVNNRLSSDTTDSWLGAWLFPPTLADKLTQPAIAFRGRRLFDSADPIRRVAVMGKFALVTDNGAWKLTEPLASEADAGKAGQLATTLLNLQATEFLREQPTAEELQTFGLATPASVVQLTTDSGRVYTLELGAARPGRAEVFARLDGGSVFGLANTTLEPLTTGAIGLLPLNVWSIPPEQVTALEIVRHGPQAGESFALARDGTNWKLTGPFTAPVSFLAAQPLLTTLGNLTATRYQALAATNPAEFGFDRPLATVKLTASTKKPDGSSPPETRTLTIGNATPEGDRYATLGGPVFVVPAPLVAAAQTAPLSLLDRSLLVVDSNQITRVRIVPEASTEAFTLSKDEQGKWTAEGATFAVDRPRIDQLLSATVVQAERLAAYGDQVNWAEFGLDKPTVTVTLTLAGEPPQTHTIAVGKPVAPGSDSRYARVNNGPAVAVLSPAASTALTRRRFDYADRTLLTFDPATLTGLTRQSGSQELTLAPGAAIGWDIVKPARHKADADLMDELAAALGQLRAERVAAYGKKEEVFKQHGLEPPAALLTLTVGETAEQKTLRIGNPVNPAQPEGDRFAAVDSPNPEAIVGVLPAPLVTKLLAPPVAFRDRTLARFVDADKAVLQRGDRTITFSKTGGTWKVTEPLMTAAESAELDALIADLGKLRADTWVAEKTADLKPFGLDKPEAKWTLSNGDRTVLVLLVGKRTAEGRVPVTTEPGELVGLLSAPLTTRVLAEYRQRRPWDVDAAQVDAITIDQGASKFTLQKTGGTWSDPAQPGEAINSAAVTDLLGTLGSLRVERYVVDTNADLKLFGLDKPEFTLTLTTPAGPRVLALGAPVGGTDGQQRYARIAEPAATSVFVLSTTDTQRLTRDRAAYRQKK
jgi:hypothetical protein